MANISRQYEALLNAAVQYCARVYKTAWSIADAESALFAYLQYRSVALLSLAVEGTPIIATQRIGRLPNADFLINAFILHIYQSDPSLFSFMETIVKGYMLSNVLYLPDISSVTSHFHKVDVYLDTRVILRALGFAGDGFQATCREMVTMLLDEGARLSCFEHTFNETAHILESTARALRDRRRLRLSHSETLEYFLSINAQASDVELQIARLKSLLQGLGIKVKRTPDHILRLGIDETKLGAVLRDFVGYYNDEALKNDISSLTAVYRIRDGLFPTLIEACGAVFVTTNYALARHSTQFFRDEYREANYGVPLCIMDHTLTTLVWLKKPLAAPDLPKKQLIADSFAALNPGDALWRRYLLEVDKLEHSGGISAEDFYLLRYSMVARNALMDVTLGNPDAFAEGTVSEVLAVAQAHLRAEAEEARSHAEKERDNEKQRRIDAERRVVLAEANAERSQVWATSRIERMQADRRQRYRSLARKTGQRISIAVFGLGGALLVLASFLSMPKPFPTLPGRWTEAITPVAFFALFVFWLLALGHISVGLTLWDWVKKLEDLIALQVEVLLARVADSNTHDSSSTGSTKAEPPSVSVSATETEKK